MISQSTKNSIIKNKLDFVNSSPTNKESRSNKRIFSSSSLSLDIKERKSKVCSIPNRFSEIGSLESTFSNNVQNLNIVTSPKSPPIHIKKCVSHFYFPSYI